MYQKKVDYQFCKKLLESLYFRIPNATQTVTVVPARNCSLRRQQWAKFMAESSVEISKRSPPPQLAVVLAHAQTRESLKTGRLKVILRLLPRHVRPSCCCQTYGNNV